MIKPFSAMTTAGQVRRLRRLDRNAPVSCYPPDAEMRLIQHA